MTASDDHHHNHHHHYKNDYDGANDETLRKKLESSLQLDVPSNDSRSSATINEDFLREETSIFRSDQQ